MECGNSILNMFYGATVVASAASKNSTFLASLSCYLVINFTATIQIILRDLPTI